MKKHLVLALMALMTCTMISCGDDNDEPTPAKTVENVISVKNAKFHQGNLPKTTEKVDNITKSILSNNDAIVVAVTSPVDLTKFYLAVDGVEGYVECPASTQSPTRSDSKTYYVTISILQKSGVNQNVVVAINAETVDGKVVFVMKEKLEVKNEEDVIDDAKALIGTWEFIGEQCSTTLTIDKTTFTYVDNYGGLESTTSKASYRFKDGMVYLKFETSEEEEKIKPILMGEKNVLVLRHYYTMENEDSTFTEVADIDNFEFFVKKGATLKATAKDIEGTWIWHLHGDQDIVRSALILKDNTFDMYIPIWVEHYHGTYTYKNGYIDFKVTKFETRLREVYDESMEDLYKGWKENGDEGHTPSFDYEFSRPFWADGNIAYSNLANLPVYYEKQ